MNPLYLFLLFFITTSGWAQSGGNTAILDISGNNNNIEIKQTRSGSIHRHITEIDLIGNNNSFEIKQAGNGHMTINLTVTGNSHIVDISQKNQGNHSATITLINSGGASNFTLLQQGSIPNQLNFYQSCANPSGCSATVIQPLQ